MELIAELNQYNTKFSQNDSFGDTSKKEVFEFYNRSSNLILSAPHSTRSFCNKKIKIADLYTGAIVEYLGKINDISTIVRTKYLPQKVMISDYIAKKKLQNHYFLDIHGFNQDIEYDICLGTGLLKSDDYPFLKDIFKLIKTYNLKPIINHPDYTGKVGLTGRYQDKFLKPNVIQMEIKYYLRDFYHNPEIFKEKTLPLMNDIINLYK